MTAHPNHLGTEAFAPDRQSALSARPRAAKMLLPTKLTHGLSNDAMKPTAGEVRTCALRAHTARGLQPRATVSVAAAYRGAVVQMRPTKPTCFLRCRSRGPACQ
jgi:hypothetical protein